VAPIPPRPPHPFALHALMESGRRLAGAIGLLLIVAADTEAQKGDRGSVDAPRLALGFAVDTTVVPATTWGVDPALAARPAVVRLWRDYLAVRTDSSKRGSFWSAADRRLAPDPDLALTSADYIGSASAVLIEALPLVAGDSARWVLRTVYVGGGTASRPGLLAVERVHVVREDGRWALTRPAVADTAGWRRERVGVLEFIVHPSLSFDRRRAEDTARWVDETARRFGVADPAPISYFQLPNLEAAWRVAGLDWAVDTDRVGGRAYTRARIVLAADPRFGEAYRHEIAHVLLSSWTAGAPAFVGEGVAYWLGGARGVPFPAMMGDLANFLARHPAIGLRAVLEGKYGGPAASAQFPSVAGLFELAHRRGGDAGVRRLVEAARRERPTPETIAAALALSPGELETAWRALVASYRASS